MKTQQSSEDYLEMILVLNNRMAAVRSIDIVNEMGFSKPSVSVAMKNLRMKNLIAVDGDGFITLTEDGLNIASHVYERHTVLTQALIAIGVPEDIAKEDACKVEHNICDITFEKIKNYVNAKLSK